MRGKISKRTVDALKPGEIIADTGDGSIKGFTARCLPSGNVAYGFRFRDPATRKEHWIALGRHGNITPDEARDLAKQQAGKLAFGNDLVGEREAVKVKASGADTVNFVLDAFVERHVRRNLRAAAEVERVFTKNVRPAIGEKPIRELRRRDVVELLDAIEDRGSPVMADRTLAHLRKALRWWATRDDTFVPPIVPGMARTKPAERSRKRVLDDVELRDVWQSLNLADAPACYPAYVRALLLTAQRRTEVAKMRWEEIDGSVWTIPGAGHKTGKVEGEKVVPLTDTVAQLLGKSRKAGFVFSSTDGELPFSGFSKAKRALDKAVTELRKRDKRKPMPHWTLHDLRRTARSLMSRAGVAADIAERVLGHKIAGVRGVYDRHEYVAEKRDALGRLAALISRIVDPIPTNVIPMPAKSA
jgi:integrase